MAHQWFGDLVTTAWWNDIWLNEAFATWMETKIVNEWRPSWNVDVSAVEDKLGAMHLDRLASARKIRQPIESADDIANAFDGITYQKGAAIINMFEHWLGADRFRDGVRLYMREYADKSATSGEFLAALSKGAGEDIAPAFSTFLNQPGVPVISTHVNCSTARPQLELTQSRYRPIGSPAPKGEIWSIPVCVNYSAGGETYNECSLITQPSAKMALKKAAACPAWVDANAAAAGYYRVDYDREAIGKLMRAASKLSLADKIELLSDLHALVLAGKTPPSAALAAVPEFAHDSEREVVTGAQQIASLTVGKLVSNASLPRGRRFVDANFAQRAEQLGWKPKSSDTDDDELLRLHLVPFVAIDGNDPELRAKADELARVWLKDHSTVDREVAPAVLTTAARGGDAALFEALLAAAKKTKESHERRMLLAALGSFGDPALAKRAMNLLLTGEFDMREAFSPLLFGPLSNRATRQLPFEFVREHLDQLLKLLPREVGGDFAAVLPETGRGFCDAKARDQIVSFFGPRVKEFSGGERNLAQVLEGIDLCIQQRATLGPEIERFLKANESR
jgi:alanyl aminopeptidase